MKRESSNVRMLQQYGFKLRKFAGKIQITQKWGLWLSWFRICWKLIDLKRNIMSTVLFWVLLKKKLRIFLLCFAAAVVEGTIFCAHAGLSPQLYDLDLVSKMVNISHFGKKLWNRELHISILTFVNIFCKDFVGFNRLLQAFEDF